MGTISEALKWQSKRRLLGDIIELECSTNSNKKNTTEREEVRLKKAVVSGKSFTIPGFIDYVDSCAGEQSKETLVELEKGVKAVDYKGLSLQMTHLIVHDNLGNMYVNLMGNRDLHIVELRSPTIIDHAFLTQISDLRDIRGSENIVGIGDHTFMSVELEKLDLRNTTKIGKNAFIDVAVDTLIIGPKTDIKQDIFLNMDIGKLIVSSKYAKLNNGLVELDDRIHRATYDCTIDNIEMLEE